jgi:hypothetical protein
MRNTTPLYLLPGLFLFLISTVRAQYPTAGFDTIFHVADRVNVNKFHFEHADFKDVGFQRFSMNLEKPSARNGDKRRFFINGVIDNSIAVLNWDVSLFGDWKKVIKLRLFGESGEWGDMDITTKDKFSWSEKFTGYIRTGIDTISNFSVYTKPASQDIFAGIIQIASSYNYTADPEHFKKAFQSKRNFAVSGNIDDSNFKLIYIEPIRMVWIFKEEGLHAVFATEDIYNPDAVRAGGQVSNKSFLLLKPGHRWDDEAEMIRLSMLTMLIADLVKPGNIY